MAFRNPLEEFRRKVTMPRRVVRRNLASLSRTTPKPPTTTTASASASAEEAPTALPTPMQLICRSIQTFYNHKPNRDALLHYLNHYKVCTLEWFVTNYSKLHITSYTLKRPGLPDVVFRVHAQYQSQLAPHGKALFDPYCRGPRIQLNDEDGKPLLKTTIRQLNFFMWAIQNGVVKYVQEHYEEIHADLARRGRKHRAGDGKKRELSISATRSYSITSGSNLSMSITEGTP